MLLILLAAAVVLACAKPVSLPQLLAWINGPTLEVLAGLGILTQALEHSGVLERLAWSILQQGHSQRSLAMLLVLSGVLLSTVLTNDLTLFLLLPITMHVARLSDHDLSLLLIFEALAVNTGSLWSPVGNPQNILLWQMSGIGFVQFVGMMTPLAVSLMVLLLAVTWWVFPNRTGTLQPAPKTQVDTRLWRSALLLYAAFLMLTEMHLRLWALLMLIPWMLWRPVLFRSLNLPLLSTFLVMFVLMGELRQFAWIKLLLSGMRQHPQHTLVSAILASQVLSNVPASVLLVPLKLPLRDLAYAVNIGGYGLASGSLANLIVLRWQGVPPGLWIRFHRWSLPALILAASIGWLLLNHYA
ncbi:MAG: anion transporter [Pseudomonadales bacterium]|nr:anion transporter [Pseudomonadales bacterium]